MPHSYWVENDELYVADAASGLLTWHGKFYGKTVTKALPMLGQDQCVVLLHSLPHAEGNRYGDPPTLICCDGNGMIQWNAEAPDPTHTRQDYYLNAKWDSQKLLGWSSSSFTVEIDVADGRILSQEYIP